MADSFKFICFGSSIENLRNALEFNIIGLTKRHSFAKGEELYFTIKTNGEWKVCGRAKAGEETDLNPFINAGNYYTYTITEFEACEPYEIRRRSQDILGPYWALNFQTPRIINNDEYAQFIIGNFIVTDIDEMLSSL